MAKKLSELYAPKSKDEKDFIARQTVKKTTDKSPSTTDKNFKGNTKFFDRASHRFGYNPGADEKAYDNGRAPGPNDMLPTKGALPPSTTYDVANAKRATEATNEEIQALELASQLHEAPGDIKIKFTKDQVAFLKNHGHKHIKGYKYHDHFDKDDKPKSPNVSVKENALDESILSDKKNSHRSHFHASNRLAAEADSRAREHDYAAESLKHTDPEVQKLHKNIAASHRAVAHSYLKKASFHARECGLVTEAEEIEVQLDEISKRVLGNYIKTATHSLEKHSSDAVRHDTNASSHVDVEQYKNSKNMAKQDYDKSSSRRKGIFKAVNKLTKEDN